ncbi:hypothetical protein BASA61_003370 [Batrachochytrium salamandrivorans]|nr:hypothetical protein BASA61_003370 [Batrachochytrium salamandrivorans]
MGWTDGKATEGNNAITKTLSVNLFYLANVMHDITYQYGFTEKAGNFQKDNFGKGGQGNDAVRVMNMFRFTYTKPNRDGGFDNGIVIHEYGHGVSNRLTGGSATSGCLRTAEARGMGEGWGDALALMVLAKEF